jgi:hypothetical protein
MSLHQSADSTQRFNVTCMMPEYEAYTSLDPIQITSLDDRPTTLTAFVNGFDEGGHLKVAVSDAGLTDGLRVRVDAGAQYSASGMVLYASAEGDKYYATIRIDHPDERRRNQRMSVNTKARIVAIQPPMLVDADARVTDVSRSGIGIFTDASLPPGAILKVIMDGAIAFGEVRHCSRLNATGHYKVGVEIETVIFRNASEPGWVFTPRALWGALSLAVRKFRHRGPP